MPVRRRRKTKKKSIKKGETREKSRSKSRERKHQGSERVLRSQSRKNTSPEDSIIKPGPKRDQHTQNGTKKGSKSSKKATTKKSSNIIGKKKVTRKTARKKTNKVESNSTDDNELEESNQQVLTIAIAPRKDVLVYLKENPDDISDIIIVIISHPSEPEILLKYHYGVQHFLSLLGNLRMLGRVLTYLPSSSPDVGQKNNKLSNSIIAPFSLTYREDNLNFFRTFIPLLAENNTEEDIKKKVQNMIKNNWQLQILYQLKSQIEVKDYDRFQIFLQKAYPLLESVHSIGGAHYAFLFFEKKQPGDGWIFNIGEAHDYAEKKSLIERKEAVSFISFLFSVLRRSPKRTFHLFLERQYIGEKMGIKKRWKFEKTTSSLGASFKVLRSCLTLEKLKCKTFNLFSHYVDPRPSFKEKTLGREISEAQILSSEGFLDSNKTKKISFFKSEFFDKIMSSKKSLITAIVEELFQKEIYKKAWKKVKIKQKTNPEMMLVAIPSTFTEFVVQILEIETVIEIQKKNDDKNFLKLFKAGYRPFSWEKFRQEIKRHPDVEGGYVVDLELAQFFYQWAAWHKSAVWEMDILLLLRLLYHHQPNSISFILAGAHHSRVYSTFFEKYGKSTLKLISKQEESACEKYQCLNVEPFVSALSLIQ